MRKNVCAVVGMLFVLSLCLVSVVHAEEEYKKYGVRLRAIFVMPTESFDHRLSAVNPKVSDDVIPELDLEYFFMKKLSAELIAGVTKHEITVNGNFEGSTWLLPPTLTVKYHPLAGKDISPYVGVGLNVTLPFKTQRDGDKSFSIDNSVGWAAQAGADVRIKDNLYFNIDYKYINADTKVTIGGTKYDLDLNPHLFGLGVGYRF